MSIQCHRKVYFGSSIVYFLETLFWAQTCMHAASVVHQINVFSRLSSSLYRTLHISCSLVSQDAVKLARRALQWRYYQRRGRGFKNCLVMKKQFQVCSMVLYSRNFSRGVYFTDFAQRLILKSRNYSIIESWCGQLECAAS